MDVPSPTSEPSVAPLSHSEALLKTLLQQSDDAILSTCPAGHIVHWNAAAERLYGYSPSEALQQPLTLLSFPEEHPQVWHSLECLRSGCVLSPREQLDRHREGHELPVECRWFRLADRQGHFLGAALRSRVKPPAQDRSSHGGLLSAQLAHDLNNLLAIINGCATLLEQQPLGDELARRYVQQIAKAGQRAVVQTEQLMQAHRATENKSPRKRLDLNEHLQQWESTFQQVLGATIPLKLRPAIPLPSVEVDALALEQALLNLVINARHAMPSGGWLTLETDVVDLAIGSEERTSRFVLLLVRDTGVGMSAETQAKLFTPYFTTRPGVGTGLGLISVSQFVRQSQGHLTVESQPGLGTCFRLYFPTEADA
jgi:PAS domain S-box-containing protein